MDKKSTPSAPGRDAANPWSMPLAAWKEIGLRAWREAGQDNISIVASGVAFCGVLALVPMLGAIVMSYGLIATPATVIRNMQSLTAVMPADAAKLIGEQLANVVQTSGGKKGLGLLLALGIALYGAMKGAGSVVTALNIAYDEEETRGFVRLNLLALTITVGALLLAILAVISIAAMGHLETVFPELPGFALVLGKIVSYLVMAGVGAGAAATLYRYGPDRRKANWVWLTPGSVLTAALWLLATLGFGFYVANFGSYDATYGSLGAAIVLLTWLNLSAYILLLGAELNCELERQTARDTTAGADRPIGDRGAYGADTVAGAAEASSPKQVARPAPGRPPAAGGDAPSPVKDFAIGRVSSRVARVAGLPRAGILPSVLATAGIALLRRRGKATAGAALLAASGGLSWLTRRR